MISIHACACMGPMYGEPLCPCAMEYNKIPRSEEYKAEHTPEAIKERNDKLDKALSEVYGYKIERKYEHN